MQSHLLAILIFAWASTAAAAGGIRVQSATYGANCGAQPDNVLYHVDEECGGRTSCDYAIDVNRLGDPAKRCSKDYEVVYRCGRRGRERSALVDGEAHGRQVRLDCSVERAGKLRVTEATYGANCGTPAGNVTAALAHACDGQPQCQYAIDVNRLGDPARKCSKDFAIYYECVDDGYVENASRSYVPPEAHGQMLSIACGSSRRAFRKIEVLTASYGANCRGRNASNATRAVASACDGKAECAFRVDLNVLGDPAHGCTKDFTVDYRCNRRGDVRTTRTPIGVEAAGRQVSLICRRR